MSGSKIKALAFGFIFSVLMSVLGFSGKCESISGKILRFHVVANSDSAQDQSLKLKLRDEILKNFGCRLRSCHTLRQAKEEAENMKSEIRDFALKIVRENGFDYDVNVQVTKMHFNIRRYEEVTLPAGTYEALRVTIGKGEGKNWWCVMFPPMCLPAAKEKAELSSVLNSSEVDIVENESEYIVKFKLLEALAQVKNFFEENVCQGAEDLLEDFSRRACENYEVKFRLAEDFKNLSFF